MSDELFVDAAAPFVFSDDAPLAFFKSTRNDTWLYAARAARMATDADGKYLLNVVRVRRKERNAAGSIETVTKGGSISAQVNVAPIAARPDEWTVAIKEHSPFVPGDVQQLTLQPLGLRKVVMSIHMAPGLVENPERYQRMEIGNQASVPIELSLTPEGADRVWALLQAGKGLPITIQVGGEYAARYPRAHFRITADTSKVYDLLDINVKARASYFGAVGVQGDVSVLRSELVSSGAVNIEWVAKPEGFDESRVAELQKSILDSFAKSALQLMVASADADPAVAPDPDGFFGGVSVALKSKHEVANLDLSGEFKEAELRTETFGYAFTFAQLPNLTVADYGVLVQDDNTMPITLNFGRDPRGIEKYICQYGYRRSDGTVQSDVASAAGADGLVLTGLVQWAPGDPTPEKTEFQFLVDWTEPEWEDISDKKIVDNGDSGVLFTFTPGVSIREVMVMCSYPMTEPGTFAAIEWRTVLPPNPDGTQPKDYGGAFVYQGAGRDGQADLRVIRYPVNPATMAKAVFEWEATLVRPNGTVLTQKVREPAMNASAIVATPATLKPAVNARVPRSLAALVPSDTGLAAR